MACTFHCAACGAHFHSLEGFDAHRAGDHATGRYCVDPDECDLLVVATDDGVCRLVGGAGEVAPVTIYRSRRHAEDHGAVFRLRSAERQPGRGEGDLDPAGGSGRHTRALAVVA